MYIVISLSSKADWELSVMRMGSQVMWSSFNWGEQMVQHVTWVWKNFLEQNEVCLVDYFYDGEDDLELFTSQLSFGV